MQIKTAKGLIRENLSVVKHRPQRKFTFA